MTDTPRVFLPPFERWTAARRAAVVVLSLALSTALHAETWPGVAVTPEVLGQHVEGPALDEMAAELRQGPLADLGVDDGVTLPDANPQPLLDRLPVGLDSGNLLYRVIEREPRLIGEARSAELEALLRPPQLSAPREVEAADGSVIHYETSAGSAHALSSRDRDDDGVPDAVNLVQQVLDELDIEGLEVWLARSAFPLGHAVQGARRFCVVSPDLSRAELTETLAYHSTWQRLAIEADDDPLLDTWIEAFASQAAARAYVALTEDDLSPLDLLPPAEDPSVAQHARRAWASPGVLACRGDAAFLEYLVQETKLSQQHLPSLWKALAESARSTRDTDADDDTTAPTLGERRAALLAAFDEFLAQRETSLSESVSRYHAWHLEQELGEGLTPTADARLSRMPEVLALGETELPPMGQWRCLVDTPLVGGLQVRFQGDSTVQAELFVTLVDGAVLRLPIDEEPLKLAGAELEEVLVLVQRPDANGPPLPTDSADDAGGLRLEVDIDARYPFVLTRIGTTIDAGQIRLDWHTDNEDDLAGWVIERAQRASGPWIRMNGLLMPAESWPDQPASYSFLDDTVEPLTRYFYRVVGVTTNGLEERSSKVSAVSLPPGPRPPVRRLPSLRR
ncbi:MAG: hypothetical protein AAF533_13940 [Acidobacteriota bacterium]